MYFYVKIMEYLRLLITHNMSIHVTICQKFLTKLRLPEALLLPDRQRSEIYKGDNPMKKLNPEAEKIMIERFGKDTVIALATVETETSFC